MSNDDVHKRLTDIASRALERARHYGAEAADAIIVEGGSINAGCRLGKWEDIESSESRDMGLRVFVDNSQANVSTTDFSDEEIDALAERAVAMARVSPDDPLCGLADPDRLARDLPELELSDGGGKTTEELRELANRSEDAAWKVPGVSNSLGATATAGYGGIVLVTSDGFQGAYHSSSYSVSCAMVAGDGTAMERDYEFCTVRHFSDMDDVEEIGREASLRALRRLNPKKVSSQAVPIVYDKRVSSSLVSHLSSAISGTAIARGTSMLKDAMGKQVFSSGITIKDDPHRKRGLRSKPFDAEGVQNGPTVLVEDGVLQTWVLDSRTARQLGLETTGHAGRGIGSPPSPSVTNLYMEAGSVSRDDLIGGVKNGLYVTDLIGMGVSTVTGDYSRGASGFWIENGEIAYPVSEVTIAGNLKNMFMNITAADDLEFRQGTDAPTVLVEGMTVAGT